MAPAPNISGSKPLLPDTRPTRLVKSAYSCGFFASTARKGRKNSTIQIGWLHNCRPEMSVMPRITSGMMTSDEARYSTGSGQSRYICSASARMAASSAKKMKVKLA